MRCRRQPLLAAPLDWLFAGEIVILKVARKSGLPPQRTGLIKYENVHICDFEMALAYRMASANVTFGRDVGSPFDIRIGHRKAHLKIPPAFSSVGQRQTKCKWLKAESHSLFRISGYPLLQDMQNGKCQGDKSIGRHRS